jgi:hypothetical protein
LTYTLGDLVVSSDGDMRPHALMDRHPESLGDGEIAHGRLVTAGQDGLVLKSFDVITAFLDVLGQPVSAAPSNHARGPMIIDSAMELETNASLGVAHENGLTLAAGSVPDTDIVKMAPTFRTGTSDIDAIDFVALFLLDEPETDIDALNATYVLSNFRPAITARNWRMDCGVGGYDNTVGLPPFFPTRLRFEDYSYRLCAQHDGVGTAYVDAVQTHAKSNYVRNPPAHEIFNEEVASLLKRKICTNLTGTDDLGFGSTTTPKSARPIAPRSSSASRICMRVRSPRAPAPPIRRASRR